MPYILKELIYNAILYDHGENKQEEIDDSFISLDDATPEEIKSRLGKFNE